MGDLEERQIQVVESWFKKTINPSCKVMVFLWVGGILRAPIPQSSASPSNARADLLTQGWRLGPNSRRNPCRGTTGIFKQQNMVNSMAIHKCYSMLFTTFSGNSSVVNSRKFNFQLVRKCCSQCPKWTYSHSFATFTSTSSHSKALSQKLRGEHRLAPGTADQGRHHLSLGRSPYGVLGTTSKRTCTAADLCSGCVGRSLWWLIPDISSDCCVNCCWFPCHPSFWQGTRELALCVAIEAFSCKVQKSQSPTTVSHYRPWLIHINNQHQSTALTNFYFPFCGRS